VIGPIEESDPRLRHQALAAAIKATTPDVIYVAKGAPIEGSHHLDRALRRTAPLVWFEHDARPPRLPTPHWATWRPALGLYARLPIWLNAWRHRRATRVLTNSRFTAEKLRRHYGIRTDEVIPLGVALDRFHPADQPKEVTGVRLGLVSRPDIWMKGLDCAFAAIAATGPRTAAPLEVIFPVAAPHRARIQSLVDASGATPWVCLVAPASDEALPSLYASFDALLVASRDEGGPLTMLEAMACGTPVIATPVGLVPEVVEDGVNGIRVSATESVDALVSAIERFLALAPDARTAMGHRARTTIERNHDAAHHFARLRTILHEVARR
jgi:glycosyltransferase involved in cell wall biosynthesis